MDTESAWYPPLPDAYTPLLELAQEEWMSTATMQRAAPFYTLNKYMLILLGICGLQTLITTVYVK
jgi:hypothetical protein